MAATKHRYYIEDGEITCECGNTPFQSGFETCMMDGTLTEPFKGPKYELEWDSHYKCNQCGLVHEACRATYGEYCECPGCNPPTRIRIRV